jgi:hypothetical protein
LGPLLFALGIAEVVATAPKASYLGRWYLDDGTFLCTPDEATAIMSHLVPGLSALGLTVNTRKTTLWGPGLPSPEHLAQLPPDSPVHSLTVVPYTPSSAVKVLGVPVSPAGSAVGSTALALKTVQKLEDSLAAVCGVHDRQVAHALMRVCVGANRLAFLLRVLDTDTTLPLWDTADAALRQAWGRVVGGPLTTTAWIQSTLPVSMGGCGITSVNTLGPVARLAGILQFLQHGPRMCGSDDGLTVRLRRCTATIQAVSTVLPPELAPLPQWRQAGTINTPPDDTWQQSWWWRHAHEVSKRALLAAAHTRDVPRLVCTLQNGSGTWMSAPPSVPLGTAIPPGPSGTLL